MESNELEVTNGFGEEAEDVETFNENRDVLIDSSERCGMNGEGLEVRGFGEDSDEISSDGLGIWHDRTEFADDEEFLETTKRGRTFDRRQPVKVELENGEARSIVGDRLEEGRRNLREVHREAFEIRMVNGRVGFLVGSSSSQDGDVKILEERERFEECESVLRGEGRVFEIDRDERRREVLKDRSREKSVHV